MMRSSSWSIGVVALVFVFGASKLSADELSSGAGSKLPEASSRSIDFGVDVEPLLKAHCHRCHGAKRQKGGLRLDSRELLLTGGDSGPVVVPGKSAASDLVARVAGVDPETAMPPGDKRLSDEEVGVLRAWIDQGVKWSEGAAVATRVESDHWAFQPLGESSPPAVKDRAWVRNPIDAFVLNRLEGRSIQPSPEARRATLLRRLSLDLTGLLPTPEEVLGFTSDERPDAYERVVERLLSSSHFGERWGRHWLDLARYADSDGYEKDNPRPHAWRYRNWVIDTINADLPFDEFTLEQLAGDLLPGSTLDQKIATGFHRNTLTNTEGGTDQEEFRVKATVDRANTTASVWLGLTLGCAQCHSHKYDPISQREYYGMFAFFNTLKEINVAAALPTETAEYERVKAIHEAAQAQLDAAVAAVDRGALSERQRAWETRIDELVEWEAIRPASVSSDSDATLTVQPDASVLASGDIPSRDIYTLKAETRLTGIQAFQLELLPHESLPAQGPGRGADGKFVLTEIEIEVTPLAESADGKEPKPEKVVVRKAVATESLPEFDVSNTIDGNRRSGWSVKPHSGKRQVVVLTLEEGVGFEGGTRLTVALRQRRKGGMIGRFRLSLINVPEVDRVLPSAVAPIAAKPIGKRTASETTTLSGYYRSVDPEVVKLQRVADDHAKQAPPPPPTMAQTLVEHTPRRSTRVLVRGDFLRPGVEVGAQTLSVLHQFRSRSDVPDRVDLVNWLMHPENPLTSRVTVNRIWQRLFGVGLVDTPDDFGVRGSEPSHRELLDWLAREFMRNGWGVKRMIRFIVGSATYRQSSSVRDDLEEVDSKNRLLARQNRYRLEAELVRDVYLAASGLLARHLGGRSVYPPLPQGVTQLGYGRRKWPESEGADRYRRGLYIFFQRTVPYPMLTTFDAPESNVTCIERRRSNTPLQALTLLNDPVFHECAKSLGARVDEQAQGDVSAGVRQLYLLAVGRRPSEGEAAAVRALYKDVEQLYRDDVKQAENVVGRSESSDVVRRAAWMAVARTILNLDEVIVRG